MSPKNLNRHMAHWHVDLQEYNFNILYIPRKTNTPPDTLSHPPGADQGKDNNLDIIMLPLEKFKIATMEQSDKIHVPPFNMVKRGIMNLIHDHPMAGHPRWDETLWKTQEYYYWPEMKEWITEYIKGYTTCQ
jgi:hypothetical protein